MTRALIATIVALALLSGLVGWQLAESRGDVARLDAAVHAGKLRELAALARLDSLAGVQKGHDRVFTRLLTRWDTVKAGTDTLLRAETVTVTRDVLRTVLVTADSTVQACVLGRATCEQRVQAQADRAEALAGQRDALAGQLAAVRRRGLWEQLGTGAAGFGACTLLNAVRGK